MLQALENFLGASSPEGYEALSYILCGIITIWLLDSFFSWFYSLLGGVKR